MHHLARLIEAINFFKANNNSPLICYVIGDIKKNKTTCEQLVSYDLGFNLEKSFFFVSDTTEAVQDIIKELPENLTLPEQNEFTSIEIAAN